MQNSSGANHKAGTTTARAPRPNALALPYFAVLVLALLGINVFVVLLIGVLLFLAVGMCLGQVDYAAAFSAMGDGHLRHV